MIMFCENCGKQIAEGSQFCELCGTKQGVAQSISSSTVAAPARGGVQGMRIWLTQKNLLVAAVLLVAISLFYYFLIRPVQERKAYEDCFGALNEADQLPVGIQTSEKNFRIDSCVKSRGASEIRANYSREQERKVEEQVARDATEKRKAEEELAKQRARKISNYDFQSIELPIVNSYVGNRISGSIKNGLSYSIQNIVIHVDAYTDRSEKNKVGEANCGLRDFVIYANSTKKYSVYCNLEESANWFIYRIISAEKIL